MLDEPRAVMAAVDLNPPLAALGKAKGWRPLPLTVKQARRFLPRTAGSLAVERSAAAENATLAAAAARPDSSSRQAKALAAVDNVAYSYGSHPALHGLSFDLRPGEVVALMGRNGSGKSTLLKLLAGLHKPTRGSVRLAHGDQESLDTRSAPLEAIVRVVGYVPQNPGALLFKDTVLEELAFTRQGLQLPPDPAADRALLASLGLGAQAERYPRDLSSGQRQRVALAAILVAQPSLLLLDEPTRGLDYAQKAALAAILLHLRRQGRAILLATHDVELAARCADRVLLLGEGQVVVDGPIRQVMTGSLVFASQVNKLYRDPRYLVVEDAVAAP